MTDLLDYILQVFGLSVSDLAALAASIRDALLAAVRGAYRRWNKLTGASSQDWMPLPAQVKQIEMQAQEHAGMIAQTYERELSNAASTYIDAWRSANETLDGIEEPLMSMLSEWTAARTRYKSVQIAGYETGTGADLGTTQFVQDLMNGDLIDADTGEVIDSEQYEIGVVPSESSGDICSAYAGQVFSMEEADEIPEFPMHGNCIHEKILIAAGE